LVDNRRNISRLQSVAGNKSIMLLTPDEFAPSKSSDAGDHRYLNPVYQHLRLLESYEYLLTAGQQPTAITAAARRIASGA
jgi:hypothetical protein